MIAHLTTSGIYEREGGTLSLLMPTFLIEPPYLLLLHSLTYEKHKARPKLKGKGKRLSTLSLNENELQSILQRVYILREECRMAVIFVISLPEKLYAKDWSWEWN